MRRCEMSLTEHMIATKLGRLHVEVDGEGPAAVLWHSLFVDSRSWSRLRGLLREDRRLVLIDGPGHGKSGYPSADFDLDDCAEAASDALDALGLPKPVDWLGNAWGGHVGLTLATNSPDWCRSIAAIATPVQALSRRQRMRIVPMVSAYRYVGPVPALANAVAVALLGKEFMRSRPDDTAAVIQAFRDSPRAGMHRAMKSIMLNRPGLDPLLPRIETPTVMVVATADPIVPVAEIRTAVAHMTAARAVEVRGEGHVAPIMAQAKELAEVIRAFWRDPQDYVAR
jgi:pimeloyl-ACP methyl ester carboxylesterase